MQGKGTLGTFLVTARGERSRLSVTKSGGPDAAALGRYESGDRFPSVSTLHWLCSHYGVDFDLAAELLGKARVTHELKRAGLAA